MLAKPDYVSKRKMYQPPLRECSPEQRVAVRDVIPPNPLGDTFGGRYTGWSYLMSPTTGCPRMLRAVRRSFYGEILEVWSITEGGVTNPRQVPAAWADGVLADRRGGGSDSVA